MPELQLLRVPQVLAYTGFSERTLFRKVKDKTFPEPLIIATDKLGRSRLSAWRLIDVMKWLEGIIK
tara:strand:- start:149 stop:346 length:198 start_codon:yes stop_codon:yes gene_type:complete